MLAPEYFAVSQGLHSTTPMTPATMPICHLLTRLATLTTPCARNLNIGVIF